MIPGGDHSSRTLLFRRIRSWSEVSGNNDTATSDVVNDNNDTDNENEDGIINNSNSNSNNNNNNNDSRDDNNISGDDNNNNYNNDLLSPLLLPLHHQLLQQAPSLEYEESSTSSSVTTQQQQQQQRCRCRHMLNCSATIITDTNWKLWIVFILLVSSGVGNVIFAKLQALPMYNYPTFLNMYANGMYILMSFAYIIPVSILGLFNNSIPRSNAIPSYTIMKPFFIMGCLDAISAAMQILSTVYLPGTLLVLIPQVAIPLSMAAGSIVLREKYTIRQYAGAVVVFCGILVVLYPVLTHQREADYYCKAIDTDNDCVICNVATNQDECLSYGKNDDDNNNNMTNPNFFQQQQQQFLTTDSNNRTTTDDDDSNNNNLYCAWVSREEASTRDDDFLVFFWSIVMLSSCVPSVMSTVYKQVALQTASTLDPILINGWVSLFQFVCGLFLVVPSGLVSSPKVQPLDLTSNWMDGIHCLFVQSNTIELGCHPDDCSTAALWVHISLLNSAVYALSMLFVLKYGSCDLMYLGLTLVVPLGHLAFSFHSSFSELRFYDIVGLVVVVSGLIMYRFGHVRKEQQQQQQQQQQQMEEENHDTNHNGQYHMYEAIDGEEENEIVSENNSSNFSSYLNNRQTNQNNNDKEGFLEFLREPFMLSGDI